MTPRFRGNPFNELYVTEIIGADQFVLLFSNALVESGLPVFQDGNVIVVGVEGSGKSMLLSLLKPEIRIAYHRKGADFPVPEPYGRFLSAGINLTRSQAIDVGQRILKRGLTSDAASDVPAFFGDFLNYWIVKDLVHSIQVLSEGMDARSLKWLGVSRDAEKLDAFATRLAKERCWFNALQGCSTITELMSRLEDRIAEYRSVTTSDTIAPVPTHVQRSLTEIGEPVSKAVEDLRKVGILEDNVPVLLRIDQYEDLVDFSDLDAHTKIDYQRVVNKLLWTRDPNVSYKVGARRYAVDEDMRIHGSGMRLEKERDYQVVDLDAILRRPENSSTWLFPKFAEDVFCRRLVCDGFTYPSVKQFFGPTPSPHYKAKELVGSRSRKRIVKERVMERRGIDKEWIDFLQAVAEHDPLSAKLGEAWVLQNKDTLEGTFPSALPVPWAQRAYRACVPWEEQKHRWWKKERIQQALLQIAARAGQRMLWSGKRDVLTLSGSNILVFVSICKSVWNVWLRAGGELNEKAPLIEPAFQAVGIYTASVSWYRKISVRTKGSSRQRLLKVLGPLFYETLRDDERMSYPGHNGFSLSQDELETRPRVREALGDAVRYGDLAEVEHTPKNRGEGKRTKWYLNPILSPYFGLPASHTKEPMYVKVDDVLRWLTEARYGGLLQGETKDAGEAP